MIIEAYRNFKEDHPHCLVLVRIGDWYEAFDDDAHTVAAVLDLVLTHRPLGKSEKVPMTGIVYHQLYDSVERLCDEGYEVCVWDPGDSVRQVSISYFDKVKEE